MLQSEQVLATLKDVVVGLVRTEEPDLTARQLSIFLLIHQLKGPHTVRAMALTLDIAKPAVTRAADRLEEHGLIKRQSDPRDRRSVLLTQTRKGEVAYRRMVNLASEAWRTQGGKFRPAKQSAA